jgi:hypothetical protein
LPVNLEAHHIDRKVSDKFTKATPTLFKGLRSSMSDLGNFVRAVENQPLLCVPSGENQPGGGRGLQGGSVSVTADSNPARGDNDEVPLEIIGGQSGKPAQENPDPLRGGGARGKPRNKQPVVSPEVESQNTGETVP